MSDIMNYFYMFNDFESKREFIDKDYFELLENIKIIIDDEEIVSIDEIHIYSNNNEMMYGYDEEGGIYELSKTKQIAKLIDCLYVIRKKKKEEF